MGAPVILRMILSNKATMAINENIYRNGVRGLLSHYEINSLPEDYEMHKSMFHHATELKEKRDKEKKKENNFLKTLKFFFI